MQIGPVQLIVLGFDTEENIQSKVLQELNTIKGRGVIRLIDVLFLRKDKAGKISAINTFDGSKEERATYGPVIKSMLGLEITGNGDTQPAGQKSQGDGSIGLTTEKMQSVVEQIDPGQAVVLVLFEHIWAAGLSHAIRDAGGRMLLQGILTPETIMMVGKELEAIADAETTIDATRAIKGAVFLDALAFASAIEELKEHVAEEAAEEMTDRIKTAVAAETLRSLMAAGVVDDTEIETAVQSLTESGLLVPEIAEKAMKSANEAIMEFEEAAIAQNTR